VIFTRYRTGFTLIELIAVIVALAILSGVAIPKYFSYRQQAMESVEQGIVGAVRSAISNEQMMTAVYGQAMWPYTLDDALPGSESSAGNPFFNDVLEVPVSEGWSKGDDLNTYVSPLGNTFVYLPDTGMFLTDAEYQDFAGSGGGGGDGGDGGDGEGRPGDEQVGEMVVGGSRWKSFWP